MIPTVHAQDEHEPLVGWWWAGEVEEIVVQKSVEPETMEDQLQMADIELRYSQTIENDRIEPEEKKVVTIDTPYLRASPPVWTFWSWFTFRYTLGEWVATLDPQTELIILDKVVVGKQLWLKVEVDG